MGTAKLYGEIWKTMLRSPRARHMAIKYLEMKVPKDIDEAGKLNKSNDEPAASHRKNKIYRSKYNLIISEGKMVVETLKPG